PGWNPELSEDAFLRQAGALGLALVGQSKNLAPADGLLYALRDVTATVESIPLIASSIMSKKLAAGAHTIVLDVKVGGGAFMKTLEQAKVLARAMVDIGRESGRNVRALLTDMETPLGFAAGNALEVREALATLRGEGPADLLELCLELAREALLAFGFSEEDARIKPLETIKSGAALTRFRAFIEAQGGDPSYVDSPEKLEVGPQILELKAQTTGFLERIDALGVGQAVLVLGGGREQKGEAIDHRVGVEIFKKPGDAVLTGELLARIHHNERGLEQARELIETGLTFSNTPVKVKPLVLERVS
ncbi:MAG: thymidine phosphorylase, partial [Pseudopedobacter sp.]|nr:thymidine phosphorylase [Deinococcales bacterium]